jgi:glycosyltransferase involved in cell wall biosynthesis
MKICHVITRMIVGGAQENTLATVSGLAKKGHAVTLVSGPSFGPEGSLEPAARNSGAEFVLIRELRRNLHPVLDSAAFFRIAALLKKERYDIVHTHSAKAGILGRLAARAASPSSVVVHTVHGLPFLPGQNSLARAGYLLSERIARHATDRFISVGRVMVEQSVAFGLGTSSDYTVVYSGFPIELYAENNDRAAVRKRLGVADSEFLVGMIARFFPLKGQEYLLRAFSSIAAENPGMKLLFVGDGILRPSCEALVKMLGLDDRVLFTGLVRPEEIPEYVSALDAGAHTSLREGLPRAVVQIMAGGKPAVAFDADGAREVVLDGETGFLVPPENEKTLALRLAWLAGHPEETLGMGKAAQRMALRLFSVHTMIESIENIYETLLERKHLARLS